MEAHKEMFIRNLNQKYAMKNKQRTLLICALGLISAALVGCGGGGGGAAAQASSPSTTPSSTSTDYKPLNVDAGIPVDRSTDDKPYKALVASSSKYGFRPDPFALTSAEAAYDHQQNAERVLSTMGGFTTEYQLPEETAVQVTPEEPQPYRRLAGIIVGDSVLAILDTGSGIQIIRPGMKIPNTEWTVVSIDQDKAVLHRDGDIRPHTVTVRLESPPAGVGSATGFGGAGQFGAPGSGAGARGGSGPRTGSTAAGGGGSSMSAGD